MNVTAESETHRRLHDVRIHSTQDLTTATDLLREIPISNGVAELVCDTRATIGRILRGEDSRLLVVVGPCSVHDVTATLEYATWALEMQARCARSLLIVMRVYFEKPRTRLGWKGLINDPFLDGSFRINDGLRLARRLLLDINAMGMPTATEFLDLVTPQYIADLTSWAAVGARTVQSPVHRELASGLSCPVGFKNTTTGDVQIAIDAVVAARSPHHFPSVTKSGAAAIIATTGNPDCHVVLRGGARPNYDGASISAVVATLRAEGVAPRVMVDCSHGNCGGDYRRQLTVAEEIARQLSRGSDDVCGLMVESNLLPGRQPFVAGRPLVEARSITDPCIGLDDTAALLLMLAGESSTPLSVPQGNMKMSSLQELFASQVQRSPDAIAIVQGDSHLTYAELNRRANQIARYLDRQRSNEVGTEPVVAIRMERSLEMLVVFVGIGKAGMAYVAIEPDLPDDRVNAILQSTRATLMVTMDGDRPASSATLVVLDEAGESIRSEETSDFIRPTFAENIIGVVFTSGSTGEPKGVCLTYQVVRNRLEWFWQIHRVAPDDIVLLHRSYAVVSFPSDVLGPLIAGARIVVVSDEVAKDGASKWQHVVRHRITQLRETPASSEVLLDEIERHPRTLDSLRVLLVGGELVEAAIFERWLQAVPGVRLLNGYGLTECNVIASCDLSALALAGGSVPVGTSAPNVRVHVLDEGLRPVPPGVVGDVLVGGASVVRGYLNRPAATAERFVPEVGEHAPGGVMMRTGDRGRIRADGHLELTGRRDRQVKVRGFRVELADVEHAIRRCASVGQAVVVSRGGPCHGVELIAYFVAKEAHPSARELRRQLHALVPDYMVPRWFIELDRLPLNDAGKCDHHALPPFVPPANEQETSAVVPRTDTERKVAEIWSDVLEQPLVARNDRFAELGGHSLAAMRVASRLRDAFRCDLPISLLLGNATLGDLANHIDRTVGTTL